MNGCQFAVLTNPMPPTITTTTTATLMMTIAELKFADSLIPMMISAVTASVISTAGTFKTAASLQPAARIAQHGADANRAGMSTPTKSCRKLDRCPDQPTATVAAPRAYSRMRSQPITQAKNSPRVAYPYV